MNYFPTKEALIERVYQDRDGPGRTIEVKADPILSRVC
jgi:hypothetical protein